MLNSLKDIINAAGDLSDKWHEIQEAFTTTFLVAAGLVAAALVLALVAETGRLVGSGASR